MRRFALIFAVFPVAVMAEEFKALDSDEILTALTGRTLIYEDGATQHFEDTMLTQYISDRPSSGHWAVREDQYCSLWPPSDLWACYDVQQNGDIIRFVDAGGGLTDGVYSK